MAHDVFVSYSSKDKPTADAVCAVLESHDIRCWVAPRDILPGHDWGGSIIEAINGARAMVLVFSANANASSQIKREVERAVNKGIPVIPLRIEDVAPTATLEYFLCTPHWLDAFTPPLDRHLQYLAEVTRKIVDGPEGSIPPAVLESESREKSKAEATRVVEEKRKSAEPAKAGSGAVYQWLMIGPAKIYFIVFGLLTIVGGVMGYAKAGSTASIIAGSISGILLLLAAFLLPDHLAVGLALAAVVSIALAGKFVPAFIKTGQVMPAGLMSVLSVIGIIMAIVAWMKK
jgi:uncharacterized membrane protein (UPF0136 family)